ncbi:hypothetical protein TURU_090365 [Turdus rufiventris]|nr:hypothetical protein TURU_090365 [Turdus rufiventris]
MEVDKPIDAKKNIQVKGEKMKMYTRIYADKYMKGRKTGEEEMEVDVKVEKEEMEVDVKEEMDEEMEVDMEEYIEDMEIDEKNEVEDMVLG